VACHSPKREPRPNRRRAGSREPSRGLGSNYVRGVHWGNTLAWQIFLTERRAFARKLHCAQAPTVLDHLRALPQRDGRARPSLAGGPVGGECNLIVLDASDVLDNAFAVWCPRVDAEGEVGSKRPGHLRPLLPPSCFSPRVSASGMLLFPYSRHVRLRSPVQDLTMETWPVFSIFWRACGPLNKIMTTTPPRAPARLNRPTTRSFAESCLCLSYSGNWPRSKKYRSAEWRR
jgi:hypothetical protein